MKKSNILGCILAPLALLALVGIVGAVAYFAMHEDEYRDDLTMPGGGGYHLGGYGSWNGQTTLECDMNESGTITGVTANIAQGPAIRAGGNCNIVLEGCTLTAPVVIETSGNAQVVVNGGVLTGTQQFAVASGNSHITVNGATVSGPVSRSGLARVDGVP